MSVRLLFRGVTPIDRARKEQNARGYSSPVVFKAMVYNNETAMATCPTCWNERAERATRAHFGPVGAT